jgi:hypothetical protein
MPCPCSDEGVIEQRACLAQRLSEKRRRIGVWSMPGRAEVSEGGSVKTRRGAKRAAFQQLKKGCPGSMATRLRSAEQE